MNLVQGRCLTPWDSESKRAGVMPALDGSDGGGGLRNPYVALPDIAGCLQERDAKGSDSDTKPGHLIVAMPLKASAGKGTSLCEDKETYIAVIRTDNAGANGIGVLDDGTTHTMGGATDVIVTHALTGEGHDASEDGSQRGIPLVAEPLAAVYEKYRGSADGRTINLIAAQCHGSNVGEMGTLRAGGGDVSSGVPFVFEKRIARNGRGEPDDIVPPLKSATGSTGKGDGAALIAFAVGQGEPNADSESGVAYSLDAGRGIQGVMRSGVRRLTPVECCRLQGFPDDWFGGTGLSDSAMYRTLGNAVAVPVVEWIGKRLVEVGRRG